MENPMLDDPETLAKLAAAADMSPEDFVERYSYMIEADAYQPTRSTASSATPSSVTNASSETAAGQPPRC